ncbi:MAG: glutamate-5-semialdehyde dehydrogenase [Myxococcales bacterium]|nr:glutamate-5-semialdehyde dehydrogenase [Myxococcales bacterium]
MDEGVHDHREQITELAQAARIASRAVARAGTEKRTAALHWMADSLASHEDAILAANRADLAEAAEAGLGAAMLDRLRLDEKRLLAMVRSVREVASFPDPVGETVKQWTRPNGLRVARRRIPLGVIAIIYEARPNVTSDAAALCIKAGNAVVLRGGSEAFRTNRAIVTALEGGLSAAGLPIDALQVVPTTARDAMVDLLQLDEYIDLVIPRGGEGLIRFVTEHSRIPVIRHYKGNCHVFVERSADPEMALDICYNAKVQRPGVCNAVETILIDEAIAQSFLPRLTDRLTSAGVELRGDARAREVSPSLQLATEADFATEFLDLICAVAVVDGLDAAIRHIERYTSSHTEAIITRDDSAARRFVNEVDSSTVIVNASTRFADGAELGLGAEIGISTTRLHAYGPMGVEELTTTKFVVLGDGQIRT